MWLECIGVVSGCCCKEVYIIINYIDFLIIMITFYSSIPTCLFIKFFCSLYYN